MEMNNIPWSPILRYATPLPMNRTPVSTVALQHKSVSSVLRYATPLPINRTPVSTVGGPFPPFCGTPDPSRSTGPRSEQRRSVSSVVRYTRPRFHRLFRPSPPDGHDDAFHSDPAGWLPMNTTTQFLRSDPAMYTSPGRTYARVGVRDPARMYTYVAVFSFLHPGRCTYVYMLRARLYYDTCVPLHRPVCTYTFATRMTTLRMLRPGGSRLSGTSLPAKM